MNVDRAIKLHQQGLSMKEIGLRMGVTAPAICRAFKKAGYKPTRDKYNRFAYTEDEANFVLKHWRDKSYNWIGQQISKSGQSVAQWLQKRGYKKLPSPQDRKLQKILCKECGALFKPKQSSSVFCSTKCMGLNKKKCKVVSCLSCGKTYEQRFPRQKYCCHECSQEGYQSQHIKVRPYEFNGVKMRSTWEVKFAKWLTDRAMQWKYEPTFFRLSNGKRYCPDFYIPEMDVFYEIKGRMKPEAKEKIDMFRREYPEQTLIVLQKHGMHTYGIEV